MMKMTHTIRNFRSGDLRALAALINQADAIDGLERATTLAQLEHEMSSPMACPERDCFLAWQGDRLVGYADLYFREGDGETGSVLYCWGVVHPDLRRQGIGRDLMAKSFGRAVDHAAHHGDTSLYLTCMARDVEVERQMLYRSLGMEPARYYVDLVRPMNSELPPVRVPSGISLRTFDAARDLETAWRVDKAAFRDHWSHTGGKLEEFEHWIQRPHFLPELCFLAEDDRSGEVVGLGVNIVDLDWIAQTGRKEGYVDSLAVLREHRRRGLGAALLAQSLHALREAGMEAAHVSADTENLTGAMRLYIRLGFRVRNTSTAYRRPVRNRFNSPPHVEGQRPVATRSDESWSQRHIHLTDKGEYLHNG